MCTVEPNSKYLNHPLSVLNSPCIQHRSHRWSNPTQFVQVTVSSSVTASSQRVRLSINQKTKIIRLLKHGASHATIMHLNNYNYIVFSIEAMEDIKEEKAEQPVPVPHPPIGDISDLFVELETLVVGRGAICMYPGSGGTWCKLHRVSPLQFLHGVIAPCNHSMHL